jgi:hypothetical protein
VRLVIYNKWCNYKSLLECDSVNLYLYTGEPLPITLLLVTLSSDLVIAPAVTLYSVDQSIIIPVCVAVSTILFVKWIFCYS